MKTDLEVNFEFAEAWVKNFEYHRQHIDNQYLEGMNVRIGCDEKKQPTIVWVTFQKSFYPIQTQAHPISMIQLHCIFKQSLFEIFETFRNIAIEVNIKIQNGLISNGNGPRIAQRDKDDKR